ncbi:MAG: hypothetical protein C1943_05390 [Halochromatium sp.]|nr:hypothetical protein [Halochromatium sp.]
MTSTSMTTKSPWAALSRHHRRSLWLLGLIATLILIPWLFGIGVGIWMIVQQGWAWYWWAATLVLLSLALLLLRGLFRAKPPLRMGLDALPGASVAEKRAREALRRRAKAIDANDVHALQHPDAVSTLLVGAFQDVAEAYSPDDPVALWHFTLPELLLMVEDLSQRLRGTLLMDYPVLRHVELSWVMLLLGLTGPLGKLMSVFRVLRWIEPANALTAELRGRVVGQALDGLGGNAKAQIAVMLVEQAGETAIKLYSGGYRRRADELLPTAPTPVAETLTEPLTVLLAGQHNAGKSALLNALLGRAREPVGLLTPATEGCRAYAFHAEQTGALILVDCPGTDGAKREPWLAQAAASDLVIWVAAANRADRAADQRALAALDALTERDATRRRIPRVLVLTQADKLDPPMEWSPPYDIEAGQSLKAQQMREARQAACEQLCMPTHQCALMATRPGQPPWNLDQLYQTIQRVLPEAQQKQLERGMAKEGWFRRAADSFDSIPGVADAAVGAASGAVKKTLARSANRLFSGWSSRR